MSDLAKQMAALTTYIQAALDRNRADRDPHWLVCKETADAFDLWEKDHFPLWLSFVVAGEMREMGLGT
jgi:hypothetical protein